MFYARNPLPKDMVAQAIPSVSPARAAEYFHKTECFCFNQQPLAGGEQAEMPLQFIVDQDLPVDIKTITLSYTLFDVTEMVAPKAAIAER
jgi:cytochrome c oxidase assembly protein subunit 11